MAFWTKMDDFATEMDRVFTEVLPRVISTKIDEKAGTFSLRMRDIVFKYRKYSGELLKHWIINSSDNRNPSVASNSKKLPKKMEYLIRCICGVSDFNFIPIGVMIDSPCLEAQDRGHLGTLFFVHRTTKFEVKMWKKVYATMDYMLSFDNLINSHYIVISKELSRKIKEGVPFSLDELIPHTIMEKWLDTTIPVVVKVYSNRDKHVKEIINFNNTEDSWTTHQTALRLATSTLRKYDVNTEDFFDAIYEYVNGNDYFIGNKIFFKQHGNQTAKAENAEEEILYRWLSSFKYKNDRGESPTPLEMYRLFQTTDADKLKKQYESLFSINRWRNPKYWGEEFNFLHIVAKYEEAYLPYENALKTACDPFVKKDATHTNLKDITIQKLDAALMYCLIIRRYIDDNKLNFTEHCIKLATKRVFEEAVKMLENEDIIRDLVKAYGGHKGRWEKWFSILEDRIKTTVDADSDEGIKNQLLLTARTALSIKSNIDTSKPFPIIDRGTGAGDFVIKYIDLMTGDGLHLGHKDPGGSKEVDNLFLQFPTDNISATNRQIFNPIEHGTAYLKEVESWLDRNDDDQSQAYLNTKNFIKSVWV